METELKPPCANCGHGHHGMCTSWDEKRKRWCRCRDYLPAAPELKPCTAYNHAEMNATAAGCPACRAPGLTEALDAGDRAAHAVVDHMKIMGAASTEWTIPDGDGVWVVKVEYKEASK